MTPSPRPGFVDPEAPARSTLHGAPRAEPAARPDSPASLSREHVSGAAYAVAAYLMWGLSPVYFKVIDNVPPAEVVAHRAVWSVLFLGAVLAIRGGLGEVRAALRSHRAMLTLAATTCFIATNWFLFIWAVTNDEILQASLGYYISPLVSVAMGILILKEPLTRGRAIGLFFAGAGVLYLSLAVGRVPWISLALAMSFATYSLLRKRAPVNAMAGLFIETLLMTPAAAVYLAWLASRGHNHFLAGSAHDTILLPVVGIISSMPLVWYTVGARRIHLSTMGFLQYISPTGQFLLAVVAYHEAFTARSAIAFALIWTGLAAYLVDSGLKLRRRRAMEILAPPE